MNATPYVSLTHTHTHTHTKHVTQCENYWIIHCSIEELAFVDSFIKRGRKLL
jgi:hypothetical protein